MAELRVIADTNFLMLPGLFGVDIFSELDRVLEQKYKLVVPRPVADELRSIIVEGAPEERSAARLALDTLSRAEVAESSPPADDAILKLAQGGKCAVGTNDAELRRGLRERKIPVIYLRQKSYLAINGKV